MLNRIRLNEQSKEDIDYKNVIPYDFWKQKMKCYQLKTAMRQKDTHFVIMLNRIRLNEKSKEDIDYTLCHCAK